MSENTMRSWTIYNRPVDYPTAVVIRAWEISAANTGPQALPEVQLFKTVEAARGWITRRYPGLTCFPRQLEDVPSIVETWL